MHREWSRTRQGCRRHQCSMSTQPDRVVAQVNSTKGAPASAAAAAATAAAAWASDPRRGWPPPSPAQLAAAKAVFDARVARAAVSHSARDQRRAVRPLLELSWRSAQAPVISATTCRRADSSSGVASCPEKALAKNCHRRLRCLVHWRTGRVLSAQRCRQTVQSLHQPSRRE